MPVNTPPALDRPKDVAEYLDVTTRTLAAWRARGTGPRFTRINARGDVRYYRSSVEAFIRDGERRVPALAGAAMS
jgi:hypothetical protein